MKKLLPILLLTSLLLSACSIDWNSEKDKKITELEEKINEISTKLGENEKTRIPEYSFRTHIIQLGGLHSKLYDGVYWEIGRGEDSPQMDSSIQDLPNGLLKISYPGRKNFFTISCPDTFKIKSCTLNGKTSTNVVENENTCSFYFEEERSDIMFNCVNDKFLPDL